MIGDGFHRRNDTSSRYRHVLASCNELFAADKRKREEIQASKAAFAERLRQELIAPATQKIFFLFAHGFLEFKVDANNGRKVPYFELIRNVEPNILKTLLDQIVENQQIVMTFELDDLILNPLQEVAHYEKLGELDFKDVSRIFCEYVAISFQNVEVREYILWMRKKVGYRVWSELEEFFRESRLRMAGGKKRMDWFYSKRL